MIGESVDTRGEKAREEGSKLVQIVHVHLPLF